MGQSSHNPAEGVPVLVQVHLHGGNVGKCTWSSTSKF